jgi:hypothetical protein
MRDRNPFSAEERSVIGGIGAEEGTRKKRRGGLGLCVPSEDSAHSRPHLRRYFLPSGGFVNFQRLVRDDFPGQRILRAFQQTGADSPSQLIVVQ